MQLQSNPVLAVTHHHCQTRTLHQRKSQQTGHHMGSSHQVGPLPLHCHTSRWHHQHGKKHHRRLHGAQLRSTGKEEAEQTSGMAPGQWRMQARPSRRREVSTAWLQQQKRKTGSMENQATSAATIVLDLWWKRRQCEGRV